MLIHHYLSNSEEPFGAPNFRERFKNVLSAIGFPGGSGNPSSLRRIALSNGSGSGSRQMALGLNRSIIPCEKMFTSEAKLSKGVRTFFFIVSYFFYPAAVLAAPITVSTSKAYFAPAANYRCLNFEGTFPIGAGEDYYASALNSGAGLDEAPGGYYTAQKKVVELAVNKKFFALSQMKFYSLIPNHNFISTKSSLAFSGTNQDLGEDLSNRNLVCTGETPFQSYFTPSTNEKHVKLTAANAAWITSEITKQPSSSPYPIQLVSGYEPICTNTATYAIANLPANSTVSWKVTPGNVVSISSTSGLQTTATRLTNGGATLTATIALCTGEIYTATKYISAGGYSSGDYPVSGPSSASCGQYVYYSTNELLGAPYYNWGWPSELAVRSGAGQPVFNPVYTFYCAIRRYGGGTGSQCLRPGR